MRRHKHSLSHYHLTSANMGNLIPVGVQEVLPGDTFQQQSSALIRVSPQVAPVMHPVQCRIHHWFVPNRLTWDKWEDFITGDPDAAAEYPTVTYAQPVFAQNIEEYMGYPSRAETVDGVMSALPRRAYNLIFNEYYRDQDLVPELNLDAAGVQNCAWEKDYFTSARPWAQKGEDITIPIAGTAPIVGTGAPTFTNSGGTAPLSNRGGEGDSVFKTPGQVSEDLAWADPQLEAQLDASTTASVLDVRRAFALQRYQEARARYGSRYTEYLAYLGIKSSDARLNRPEYLGGGKQTISFSEVLQTAPDTTDGSVVGDLSGHGIAAMKTRRYRRFFEEHGYVITLMSVRPKSMYMDGLHRHFNKRTMEDYYQKELESIGQQEILNKEIYMQNTAEDDDVFGYADRYREYRENPSYVSAFFRNQLDFWHMARSFDSLPVLNADFQRCIPTERIYADQTAGAHHLWIMVNHSIQARRMVNKSAKGRIL